MKNTVLMSLLSVAGLAASANAQYSFESALVLDNDPRLAAMGVSYGANSLLPGNGVTAVGITLIVRVTSTGTAPNLGLATWAGGGSSSAPNSIFYHNDSVSNQTTALWTSAANALSRGNTAGAGTNRGLLSYTEPAAYSGSTGPLATGFRTQLGASNPSRNTASTNGTVSAATNNNQPTNNGFNNYASAGSNGNNANGWVGVPLTGNFDGTSPATAANSYPSAPGSAAILSVTASRGTVPVLRDVNDEPIPAFVNFGGGTVANTVQGSDQDPTTAGVQSVWYGVYRLIFTPRTNVGDNLRDVTVFSSGFSTAVVGVGVTGTNYQPSFSTANTLTTASITFAVPTPGAMALLGLGGLVAGRRRR
ncbi:MAG: hypothetical protein K2X32_00465 [Phycisphaerales bacterium]|nr:hypothetical protein [Phycisphaerales bacterium]